MPINKRVLNELAAKEPLPFHAVPTQSPFGVRMPATRKELANEAFCGLRPELWEAMKNKGCPQWRKEGCTASAADAEKWLNLLSTEEMLDLCGHKKAFKKPISGTSSLSM